LRERRRLRRSDWTGRAPPGLRVVLFGLFHQRESDMNSIIYLIGLVVVVLVVLSLFGLA
jgi:hypothetical protein